MYWFPSDSYSVLNRYIAKIYFLLYIKIRASFTFFVPVILLLVFQFFLNTSLFSRTVFYQIAFVFSLLKKICILS